tara:strand:+ start:578 stop:715 length:138 start_codon:yes stop_codon:yes gene_type:complete
MASSIGTRAPTIGVVEWFTTVNAWRAPGLHYIYRSDNESFDLTRR